jgi:hypothetical protein
MKQKETVKRGKGRPTDYSEVVLNKTVEYLKNIATRENMHLPKVESLALYLDVERKTLYNWAEKHPEFKVFLDKIMDFQFERLVDDGIYGGKEVNAAIIKMMLVNNHHMKDEKVNKLSGEITNKFNDRQITRIAERITSRSRESGTIPSKKQSN